jgi:FkbM family methyltransferase
MQSLVQISPRSWLGKVIRLPLRLVSKKAVVPILSGPCRGMRWVVGANIHGCWLGTYEDAKQKIVQKYVRPGMVIYDIGANAGYYSLLFSRLVGPTGKVFAFEPLPGNLEFLRRHIEINRLSNVTVIPAAVSAEDGVGHFQVRAHNSMGALSDSKDDLQVQTRSLDQFLKDHPRPDLIKMDIEGGESDALRGSRNLLQINKTTWFIAIHGAEAFRQCCEILGEAHLEPKPFEGSSLKREATPDEIYVLPRSEAQVS